MDSFVERHTVNVLGYPIDVLSWNSAVALLQKWAENREKRLVCICNTHSLVTAKGDSELARIIHNADLNTADGAPVAWLMRIMGASRQKRINGPDLMWRVCAAFNKPDSPAIFLYGNTPTTIGRLKRVLQTQFPNLRIAGTISPPFRDATEEESMAHVNEINASGAGVVWVSLGCPKQEKWMSKHRDLVNATLVGVGAAFDYHAGTISRAPSWMREIGMEWMHRLASEPRRLWRRYLFSNCAFLALACIDLLRTLWEKTVKYS